MSKPLSTVEVTLQPADNSRLANLCGQLNAHIRQIESCLGVEIFNRSNYFKIVGFEPKVEAASAVLRSLFASTSAEVISPARVHLSLQDANVEDLLAGDNSNKTNSIVIKTRQGSILGRGQNQQDYLFRITHNSINFGVGPAGTGKTFLAVACAVVALEAEEVRRIVLVRPAVEAGEKLGFLPGDLAQKVDPYLRPLYDALYEILGFKQVEKLIDRNVIEVAPLAFMRGRTLNDCFIILDEAQNTTTEQIKMFLTRVGFGSTAVITGDITQIDLPNDKMSGLKHVLKVLKYTEGISFTYFAVKDVVRHPLVQKIVIAYEAYEQQLKS